MKEWEEHEYDDDATVAGPSSPALTRNVTGVSGAGRTGNWSRCAVKSGST